MTKYDYDICKVFIINFAQNLNEVKEKNTLLKSVHS